MEKFDLSPVEWCLRRIVAERPLNFEPSRESGLGKQFGGRTRDQALICLFYLQGYEWKGGALVKPGEVKKEKEAMAWSDKQWRELYAPSKWIDPLELLGEADVDSFLSRNPAARAFTLALERSLTLGRAKPCEAQSIVRAAAEKMYPDYAKNVRALSEQLQVAVMERGEERVALLPLPAESSPLMNIPSYLRPEWKELLEEALLLASKVERAKLGPEQKEELDKQIKWAERTAKSVRKAQLKQDHRPKEKEELIGGAKKEAYRHSVYGSESAHAPDKTSQKKNRGEVGAKKV